MHVVPPPMTGNYMPSGPDIEIDYSQFTYGPKQTQSSESESQSSECDTCESNISTEPSELVSEPVVIESNVESQPKVWSDAPIIEEYESDSEDEFSTVGEKRETAVKPSAGCSWRPQRYHGGSKYNSGSNLRNSYTFKDPLGRLSPNRLGPWTGNNAYHDEFQDFNGGPVAFGGNSENQANLHAGQQEANQNAAVTTDDRRSVQMRDNKSIMDDLERLKNQEKEANEEAEGLRKKFETLVIKEGAAKTSTRPISRDFTLADSPHSEEDDSEIPPLEDIYQNSTDGIFTTSSFDDEGAVADFTNLETVVNVSPIPTSRIHSTHPRALILGDPNSAVQTRSKVNTSSGAHAFVSYVQRQKRTNHKDFHHCLFACFLSQHEPKKISEALEDESWVDAMQEELL
ncbi:hypothetical protein Tco_0581248 [Tanacetum coccineum]